MNILHLDVDEIGLENQVSLMVSKLKISKGEKDSFNYDEFREFLHRYNKTVSDLSIECAEWESILCKPQTLTQETLDKNLLQHKLYKDFRETIVQHHLLYNIFLQKNEV